MKRWERVGGGGASLASEQPQGTLIETTKVTWLHHGGLQPQVGITKHEKHVLYSCVWTTRKEAITVDRLSFFFLRVL